MRSCTAGSESSATCSSRPGLFVQKMDFFHCQMQASAEGTPDDIDAPAPRKSAWGDPRLTPTDRTNVSISKEGISVKRNCFLPHNLAFLLVGDFGTAPVQGGTLTDPARMTGQPRQITVQAWPMVISLKKPASICVTVAHDTAPVKRNITPCTAREH